MISTKKRVNRRRRPVPMSLSHHRCLVTLSLVIVDLASRCVSPMTMNNQSVVVRRWLPCRYGRRGTWAVCVIMGIGGRWLSLPLLLVLVMGARRPLWW